MQKATRQSFNLWTQEHEAKLRMEFSGDSSLETMARYHLETGGKRLRAQLVFTEGLSLGLTNGALEPWAFACELLHNATLIHDDIQDRDPIRRGQPSVWKKFGLNQAINLGDYFIFKAYQWALRAGDPKLVDCLSQSAIDLVAGQTQEVKPIRSVSENLWDQYTLGAQKKTSPLFVLTLRGVGILAKQDTPERRLRSLETLGLCYQITDDINDFKGLKQAGQQYKDLEERRLNSIIAWLGRNPTHYPLLQKYFTAIDFDLSELIETIRGEMVPEQLQSYVEQRIGEIHGEPLMELITSHSPLSPPPRQGDEQNVRI